MVKLLFEPGDIVDDAGAILSHKRNAKVVRGYVLVTTEQAELAKPFGWEITSNRSGDLVVIKRL